MGAETVKDLMVKLDEYAVVPQEASLFEAVAALEAAQESFNRNHYRHRAILVQDDDGNIVGKLTQHDVLEGLEPAYRNHDCDTKGSSQYTASYIKALRINHSLYQKPLDDLCRKAASIRVADVMYCPTEKDYVDSDTSINAAIHHLIISNQMSLLVQDKGKVIGILRLPDVFDEVYGRMKSCDLKPEID